MCPSQDHGFMSIFSYNMPGSSCQAVPYCSVIIELIAYIVLKNKMSCWTLLFAPGSVGGECQVVQATLSSTFKRPKRAQIHGGSSES